MPGVCNAQPATGRGDFVHILACKTQLLGSGSVDRKQKQSPQTQVAQKTHWDQCGLIDWCSQNVFLLNNSFLVRKLTSSHHKIWIFGFTGGAVWGGESISEMNQFVKTSCMCISVGPLLVTSLCAFFTEMTASGKFHVILHL